MYLTVIYSGEYIVMLVWRREGGGGGGGVDSPTNGRLFSYYCILYATTIEKATFQRKFGI